MRSLGFAVACGALLVGTSAQAVSLDITGVKSGSIHSGSESSGSANSQLITYDDAEVGSGGSTETKVKITSASASFESGVAVSGPVASAQSNSGLDVKITNLSEMDAVSIDKIGSTIIPAGLGFYLQDRTGDPTGGNIFTGYGQTNSGWGFEDMFTPDLAGTTFATAGFTFDIYGDDYLSNPYAVPLYTLAGSLTLSFDDLGNVIRGGNILTAGQSLGDFATAYDTDFALAYAWGEKDIDVELNKILEPGQSTNLYYRTTAYADTSLTCMDDAVTCLVAYSGFGDPIGRGGGISFAKGAGIQSLNPITGIVFDPQTIDPFRLTVTDIGGAVPEPATWISMILGFGMLGAALRRRRVLSYS